MANLKQHLPLVCSLGFALFLAANATAVWGGVFPFLPLEVQTPAFIAQFFLAESTAFVLAFFLSMESIYFRHKISHTFLIWDTGVPYFLGWMCLIGTIYLSEYTRELTIGGGILMGLGSAGLYMTWQRLFSAQKPQEGNRGIILGTLLAPTFYFVLYLMPAKITIYLIPLVFLPFIALTIYIASRNIDINQPMFQETPRTRPLTYKQTLRDYWRSSLSIGSFGLACGIMRAVSIQNPEIGINVNIIAMVSMFIAAAIFLFTWEKQGLRLNILNAYKLLFPLVITAFMIMPFFDRVYFFSLSVILYALYNCSIILMMAQCAQASRDRAVNPVFIYGFFGGVVYLSHTIGYSLGAISTHLSFVNFNYSQTISIFAIYLLALMYFIAQGGFKEALSPNKISVEPIEFIETGGVPTKRNRPSASADSDTDQNIVRDRLSKKCLLMKNHYKLSDRETEVMELIARGYTVTHIADELQLSVNTVKSHTKHIYTKLAIHKKQELLDLMKSFKLDTFRENDINQD